jgi:hypothetical protein
MPKSDVVLAALQELVDALDRRVAHVERLGETGIARDAEALRQEAVKRIRELSVVRSEGDTRETERSGGVMTDDGAPLKTGE